MYTGNKETFIKIKNFLLEKGFSVSDATHIGDDKYEFEEEFSSKKIGLSPIHKVLGWIENEKVQYKAVVIGQIFCD